MMMGNGEEDFGEGLTADEGPNVTAKLAEPNEHRATRLFVVKLR